MQFRFVEKPIPASSHTIEHTLQVGRVHLDVRVTFEVSKFYPRGEDYKRDPSGGEITIKRVRLERIFDMPAELSVHEIETVAETAINDLIDALRKTSPAIEGELIRACADSFGRLAVAREKLTNGRSVDRIEPERRVASDAMTF